MEDNTSTIERDMPTAEQLEKELHRVRYKKNFRTTLRNTIFILITVAAVAVLVAVLVLPILQIYGSSMSPTLTEGNIVATVKGSKFETGDIIAFYYNNKILVKRVIANAGDWVDIDENGVVYVNNVAVQEDYIQELAYGEETDREFPYQVPESMIFVMGDNRRVSVDSRSKAIGNVAEEQIVGKIVFRVWPLNSFGPVE